MLALSRDSFLLHRQVLERAVVCQLLGWLAILLGHKRCFVQLDEAFEACVGRPRLIQRLNVDEVHMALGNALFQRVLMLVEDGFLAVSLLHLSLDGPAGVPLSVHVG